MRLRGAHCDLTGLHYHVEEVGVADGWIDSTAMNFHHFRWCSSPIIRIKSCTRLPSSLRSSLHLPTKGLVSFSPRRCQLRCP